MNTNPESILALAREVVAAEDALNAKLAQFSAAVHAADAPKTAGKGALAIELDKTATSFGLAEAGKPFAQRLRELLESRPLVRMNIQQMREFFPEVKPLTIRKTLYYLTTNVKGFKRDKRQRGAYYFAGASG